MESKTLKLIIENVKINKYCVHGNIHSQGMIAIASRMS